MIMIKRSVAENSSPGLDPVVTDVASHDAYYARAERLLPGAGLGAHALPPEERFIIRRGQGSRLQDVRDRWYIDFVCGAGALILGHAHPAVTAAVTRQAERGIHYFGTLNEPCLDLAQVLVDAIPCAEQVVFATTGSEATFYALRMARAFTRRDKILKFEGAYHGNHDCVSFSVASRAPESYPRGRPESAGIPAALADTVLVCPYNDLDAARRIIETHRNELAAVIVEPVQRIIFPDETFLPGLRRLCSDNDVLLIFDEVVTGFRLAYGGAQEYFGVTPDLASYGKIVGGGGPLGAVAGPAEIIGLADPARKGTPDHAFVNGTLHGNPLASVAALATLAELRKPGFYPSLNAKTDSYREAFQSVLDRHGLAAIACGRGSFWQVVFSPDAPRNHADILASDQARSRALDLACLRHGLYVLPNTRRFVSAVHDEADLDEAVRALDRACEEVR
jgi:glutamate-1-semialdehyde 2,1-aminomutase